MKTEKEIREMIEFCSKSLDVVKKEYDKYIFTIYEDKYIPDICDEWIKLESKITALKWVLGER